MIINESIYLCFIELNFDEVFAANTCVFGRLPLIRYVLWHKSPLWVNFGKIKQVPNKMYHLLPMLAGDRECSLPSKGHSPGSMM